MQPEDIKSEFNVRYYYWAMEDFKREINQGFPNLKQFEGDSPYWVMNMMSEMTLDEQFVFAGALVKRFHKKAVQVTGDNITEEEKELCDELRARSLGLTPVELHRGLLTGGAKTGANRKLLRKLVKTELKQLNMAQSSNPEGGIIYNTHIGDWNLRTYVETNHPYDQLIYSHQIYSAEELPAISKHGGVIKLPVSVGKLMSLNSWLGISSETAWHDLTEAQFDQTAKQLSKLCSHFLEVAPKLLKGLELPR